MLQSKIDKILAELLEQLIPERIRSGEAARFSKATGLAPTTLRVARLRQSINADTLIKLLVAHGVPEDVLTNLPRSRPSKISKSLTKWNKIGLKLSDKERESIGAFVEILITKWKLR